MSPTGTNRIPPGGLPSRPPHWRQSRRIDVDYIRELEAELHLTRCQAKALESQLAEAKALLREVYFERHGVPIPDLPRDLISLQSLDWLSRRNALLNPTHEPKETT